MTKMFDMVTHNEMNCDVSFNKHKQVPKFNIVESSEDSSDE